MYRIDYDSQENILLEIADKLSIDDIESIAKELYSNLKGNKFFLLTDVLNVEYSFNIEELDQIVNMTNKYIREDTLIFEAILISAPEETAKSMMYDLIRGNKNHIHKIFYTKQAALEWLWFCRNSAV